MGILRGAFALFGFRRNIGKDFRAVPGTEEHGKGACEIVFPKRPLVSL